MFSDDTKIKIPLLEIESINKKSNAKVFDNSINIQMKDGTSHFFTSFLYRDECYNLIMALLNKTQ